MGQRIIFPEKGVVALDDFEPAPVGREDVRIRTLASLISIGTETAVLHRKYDDDTHFADMFAYPQLQTGNQTVGIVEEVGADTEKIRPGDRMFLRKAHASHWTASAAVCSPIPSGIDTQTAIWCGLAKIAFRAAEAAPFRLGGDTLIIGAGPVGQMAVRWATAAGMRRVAVSDLSQRRLSNTPSRAHCYAGPVIDQRENLLSLTGGVGFQTIIDSTGNAAVFKTALSLAAEFGKVILLGDTGFPSRQRLTSDMMMKGVSVVATHEQLDRSGWRERDIDALFFELAEAGSFILDGLITHRFSPDQFEDAYKLASDHRDDAIGIMFDWAKD